MATYEQLNRLTKADLKIYEGQPRFRAPRISEALGYDQYNDVRHIINRRRAELERPAYGGTLVQIAQKSTGGRPATVELLTVTQAMLVCMFSDASNAPDVREQIILAANAWYQDHPESMPFFNALLVPEPLKTEGNVTWLPQQDLFEATGSERPESVYTAAQSQFDLFEGCKWQKESYKGVDCNIAVYNHQPRIVVIEAPDATPDIREQLDHAEEIGTQLLKSGLQLVVHCRNVRPNDRQRPLAYAESWMMYHLARRYP